MRGLGGAVTLSAMNAQPNPPALPIELEALLHERGALDPQVYVDPQIHALERERVFGRSWLLLAHESHLPGAGSFVTATMGEDPVVVTRGDDGTIVAFLNQCRHRGVPICRLDEGRARSFTCSYHGWTYDSRGQLVTIPNEARLFRCPVDRAAYSAVRVPRIESRHGLVFGCWDPLAPTLEEWLGEARLYFDLAFDRPGGSEALPGISRRVVAADWKFGAEQFATDNFHAPFTHASAFAALRAAMPPEATTPDIDTLRKPLMQMSSTRGHGMGFADDRKVAEGFGKLGPHIHAWLFGPRIEYLTAKYGAEAREIFPIHMNFFPNTGALYPFELRAWQPRGPGRMEVWSWLLVDRAAPDEVKRELRIQHQRAFGVAGMAELDDTYNWVEAQRVLSGFRASRSRFNAELGTTEPDPRELVIERAPSEAGGRRFFRRWAEMLVGETTRGGAA